jgi:dihydroorotate dehydrogenase
MIPLGPKPDIIKAMGLTFAGPLGIAAGVDRNGGRIASLDLFGFGHVEIGTITPDNRLAMGERPPGLRIGISFGASRVGLDAGVIDDYCAALADAYPHADYLCANLSSPRAGRDGNSHGVDRLIARIGEERDRLAAGSGCGKPVLLKLAPTASGEGVPVALAEAKRRKFDGLVLACFDPRAVAEARDRIGGLTLISVGGVRTASDVATRLAAGADLVQVHSAFVDGRTQALWARAGKECAG